MAGTVKHLSLHRIGGVELRVVADVEDSALSVIQAEETVIRTYAQQSPWPHRYITLLILRDLTPLTRQLRFGERMGDAAIPLQAKLTPGWGFPIMDVEVLNQRPVVNVYDLADLESCHVFVNQHVMQREGYWNDLLALQGLLAHEHAHPLSENQTTLASRQFQVHLALSQPAPSSRVPEGNVTQATSEIWWDATRRNRIHQVLVRLADRVCLYGPREIFANEIVIRRGFHNALFHLDQRNVNNASTSLAGRDTLQQQLRHEVAQGNLSSSAAAALLLIGDLESYLDLMLESASFYYAGQENDASVLENVLESTVFPYLDSGVLPLYTALRTHYHALRPNLILPELLAWGQTALDILAKGLIDRGLELEFRLQKVEPTHPHTYPDQS